MLLHGFAGSPASMTPFAEALTPHLAATLAGNRKSTSDHRRGRKSIPMVKPATQ
ncbi:hypothetical protein [Paractinoplanes durhamensis]|uniref:hypothetical protein n=1 Tax=Paractinoplanes durhamensis TaxID=113563 RepID=UPI00194457DE|nr:hypothetical protein [Actinoplanes durhamensis]